MTRKLTSWTWFAAVVLLAGMVGPLGGASHAQLTPGKPSPPGRPSLTSFSPTQGTAGTSVTIMFSGMNFVPRAISVQFNPSQGLTTGKPQFISPMQISVPVQIDASAQPGNRQVMLVVGDLGVPTTIPFTITAAQSCVPGMPNCGNTGPAGPGLRGFSPLQGTQGTTATVTFTGANFAGTAAVQFTPGSGLTVQSATVVNANQVQAQVNIAPDASLGARGVVLVVGKTRLAASNTFTVVSGAIGIKMSPMQIFRLVPNQIAAGSQNVDLTLEGTNFVPGTQVTFTVGAGVPANVFSLGPARYVNSTELHVTVNVLPTALPGGRDISLQTPSQQIVTGKGMLNVLAGQSKPGAPTVLKIVPIVQQTFTKGVITLDAPPWGDQYSGEIEYHYGIPILDDSVVFQWNEQNPGLADYYELRIYAKDGTTLLTTKKIGGSNVAYNGSQITVAPTFYRPDDAFLAAVLKQRPPFLEKGFIYSSLSTPQPKQLVKMGYNAPPPPSSNAPTLTVGDLQWEVAGFHTYNKSGVAPQQVAGNGGRMLLQTPMLGQNQGGAQASTTDIEVEISTRWPLSAPAAPTGLQCNGSGSTNTGLQVNDVADKNIYDANGKPTGNYDFHDYIGDPFVLSGSFDLSRSPYAAHPHLHTLPGSQCSGCAFGTIDQVQFDNLFVDWGDGTVEPLSAQPQDPNFTNWNRGTQLSLPTNATSPYALQHAYQYPNTYTVRVFQLSEADVQNVNVSLVAASADGPGISPFLQAAVLSDMGKLGASTVSQTGVQGSFQTILSRSGTVRAQGSGQQGVIQSQAASQPQGPSSSQVAADAYMIFCYGVTITVVEDLAAEGPLHLKSIDDPDFGAYDVRKVILPIKAADRNSSPAPEEREALSPHLVLAAATQKEQMRPQQQPNMQRVPTPPAGSPAAICSTCDDGMMAQSKVHYYGQGWMQVTWLVDGTQSQQTLAVPPSEGRQNLKRPGPKPQPEPPIIISVITPLNSPGLQLKPIGMHDVKVQAEVVPQPTNPNLFIAVHQTLHALVSGPSGTGGGQQELASGAEQAQSLLKTLAAPPGSNLPPLKIGLLSPTQHSASGMGAVQYVNATLQQFAAKGIQLPPDQFVASNDKLYQVVESDPKQPCKFLFPVKSGGAFEIDGLQNHLTKNGTKYTGTGNLIIHMANSGNGGYDIYPSIPVKIDNWDVPDGEHVQTGSFDVSPQLTLAAGVSGLKGTIDRVQGQAQGEVDATLSVTLADDTLRLPGVEKPQSWSGVTSELHANGDWIKDGLTLPTTIIGWSAFQMQSNTVRLDLSHNDGDAAPLCGPLTGAQWVGVRFPNLMVTPYTMDLVSSSAYQFPTTTWGVLSSGVCGSLSTGPFTAKLGAGTISFGSINATASSGGTFTAQYKGMDIYVPWLDTHLTGDANLQSGGGKQASISFPFTGSSVSKNYGNVAFTASNIQFTEQQNLGWVVGANTHFTFSAENKAFAAFDQPFFFGMDGRGYFAKGAQTQDVSLGGSSQLAQTPVDLVSVHLTTPPSGNQVLGAQFATTVHLSEVMPAEAMQVNYEIDKSGTNYSASGPASSPFQVDVPYPSGQPTSEAHVHPVYAGGSNSEYSGSVDLSELGGPPVTGEFRLGYQGGHDYWLTRVGFSFGPTGVVLVPVPPVMNLYKVQGGLGHNFPISAFKNVGSLSGESPVIDGSFLFMAGMRVGMPDQFTYTLDGDLVIKSGGQDAGARMDFHAWLLKPPDNSNGDFQGFFQYAGSNFDGRLWGRLNFMDNAAYLDLGSSANDAAIDIHFGPAAPWHIDAGKQQGPRIHGHLLVADADMYVMLSGSGLSLGGGESINLTVGDNSVASAYFRGSVDMGLTITPQPHIAGDFSANAEAGVCVDNVCVSDGVTAQVHAEFAPLDVNATCSLPLPWPLSDITISVHL